MMRTSARAALLLLALLLAGAADAAPARDAALRERRQAAAAPAAARGGGQQPRTAPRVLADGRNGAARAAAAGAPGARAPAATAPPPHAVSASGGPVTGSGAGNGTAAAALAAGAGTACPGVEGGACRGACRRLICESLALMFNATFNASYDGSWVRQGGWNDEPLEQCWRSRRRPQYCDRFGVSCCTREDHESGDCSVVGAVDGLTLEVNQLNGSISSPNLLAALSWLHACGLTKLSLQGNDLSGTLSSEWGNFTRLTVLNLGNNWISGTIPDSLRRLKRLTRLTLAANFLNGPVPSWLGELRQLQVLRLGANIGGNEDGTKGFYGTLPASLGDLLQLQVLDVQTNALGGTLPPRLCHDGSELQMLQIRNNRFRGSLAPLTACRALTQLDISNNDFAGPLPEVSPANWSQLVTFDAGHNHLSGTIPPDLYHLPVLSYLSLQYNRLSGTIKRDVSLLAYLTELRLSHNRFTGWVDESLWTLPQLQLLDLSYNQLAGTVSKLAGLTFSLVSLNVENNTQLVGPLPPELGLLSNLDRVNVRRTGLSCVPFVPPDTATVTAAINASRRASSASNSSSSWGADNGTSLEAAVIDALLQRAVTQRPDTQCTDEQLLPCFLTFSEHVVPRTDATNMACPVMLRPSHDDAVDACSGDGTMQLGSQASSVAQLWDDAQTWDVDPAYFQYRNCTCLKGFTPAWHRNHTLLVCTPRSGYMQPGLIAAIVASAAGFLLLCAVLLLVWLRVAVQLRPRWQREKELNAHRKAGVPCGGPAAIVVTDIEHYSSLMQLNAPLTTRALGLHNAIVRRAAAAHAGHVVEQEGDSWSVAFHCAMDAVAFCLQVQQALARINWPADLAAAGAGGRVFSGLSSVLLGSGPGSGTAGNGNGSHHGPQHGLPPAAAGASGSGSSAGGRSRWAVAGANGSNGGHAAELVERSSGSHSILARLQQQHGEASLSSSPAAFGGGLLSSSLPDAQLYGRGGALLSSSPGGRHMLLASAAQQPQQQPQPQQQLLPPPPPPLPPHLPPRSLPRDVPVPAGRRPRQPQPAEGASFSSSIHSAVSEPHTPTAGGSAAVFGSSPAAAQPQQSLPRASAASSAGQTSSVLAALHSLHVRVTGRGRPETSGGSGSEQQLAPGLFRSGSSANSADLFDVSGGDDGVIPALRGTSRGGRLHGAGSALGASHSSKFWSLIGFRDHAAAARATVVAGGIANGGSAHAGAASDVLRGLRVRMGVASGYVPADRHICRCALMQLAKAVSEMANGGQILIDGHTFAGVRDRLTELGTVDAKGYNDQLWRAAAKAAMQQRTSCLFSCWSALVRLCTCRSRPQALGVLDSDALLLDMGGYYQPSLAPLVPLAACDIPGSEAAAAQLAAAQLAAAAAATVSDASLAGAAVALLPGGLLPAAGSASAGDASSTGAEVALFSILPRSLQARAKVFGARLTFKEGTQQAWRGYFEAPGTRIAELGTPADAFGEVPDSAPLPLVTMVFAEVEGGRALVRRRPEVARLVHTMLNRLTQMLIQALPERDGQADGYLCRQQEGELKFMLSFREPARALEWCLLMQEVLLYVPWPQEVLDECAAVAAAPPGSPLDPFTGAPSCSADGGGSGAAAVTGPTLKMGLAEGQPHSIMPDHLGRADYHGFSVNLAARMMDAAAQGGQVVTSAETAERIFCTWRYEAEVGRFDADLLAEHRAQQEQQEPQDPQEPQAAWSPLSPLFSPLADAARLDASSPFTDYLRQQQQQQQQQWRQQQQQQQQLAASPLGSAAQLDRSPSRDQQPHALLHTSSGTFAAASGASQLSQQGIASRRRQIIQEMLSDRSDMLCRGTAYSQRIVRVSGHHLGLFLFKGCGTIDIVTFLTDTIPVVQFPSAPRGGKGTQLMARSGPVIGLQDCPVQLPAVLPALRLAWKHAAALEQSRVSLAALRNAATAAAHQAEAAPAPGTGAGKQGAAGIVALGEPALQCNGTNGAAKAVDKPQRRKSSPGTVELIRHADI